jgi:endonuclease VIII
MPEGNEIHRWAERHTAAFAGKKICVEAPEGSRFKDAALLNQRKLLRVLAVGKHLGYDFGKDRILHIHLGMYGDFSEGTGPLPQEKGALRIRMYDPQAIKLRAEPGESKRHAWYSSDDGTGHIEATKVAWVELRGPTDCSVFTQQQWQALEARLGPDPLNDDPATKFIEKVRARKTAIAGLLMDQTVAAGVGNIYRAELLFRAKLDPFTPGNAVSEKKLEAIWKDAVVLMKAGMVDRRIITTKPKDRPTKRTGLPLKEEAHYVYRRQGKPCFVCGTKILTQVIAGRNLFWCPNCQATASHKEKVSA